MRVLFPGSFNPFTIGHKNIVDRALRLFDTVVIAVGVNSAKEENATGAVMRAEHIKAIYKDNSKVEVISYSTLTANVVKEYNIDCIIRGIRNAADLEYEDEITRVNYTVFGVETLYLLADPQLKEVSSTVARELNKYGVQI
ncbi:MAG: pantetheine-phosphate adenylyltransferase [Paludibacteraceae bacterium]|nr:pantetheine-phosphate adenylyltransferase [Paludibacteraceae bacterium]MBO7367767.1 pantetheine-phosphate adenylyltransferase [Paludibacteraceae bacterium]